MHHFAYRGGVLHAEDVALPAIADTVGTPFYCYSSATLTRHFRVFAEALPAGSLIAFAVKANPNLSVLKTLAALGAGADVVSEGELRRALSAGVPAQRIVFSGVAKTAAEMDFALAAGIHQFNVESEPELLALSDVAAARGATAPIAIRVNPDVDPRTHAKIATGLSATKFGVPLDRAQALYARARGLPGIAIKGVAVHIGSQITELAPFEAAIARLGTFIRALRADGIAITRLDLGGGLGVPYRAGETAPPLPADYGAMVARATAGLDVALAFEPGRLIAANAGVLVARVIYVKAGADRRFLILDAGMNDLMRPALYDAHHEILPVAAPQPGAPRGPYDVVGPVCETTDIFARGRDLPDCAAGDLIAFMSAGAYGAAMASEYNARPLVPEVLVHGAEWALVRPRPSYEAMIGADRMAPWL